MELIIKDKTIHLTHTLKRSELYKLSKKNNVQTLSIYKKPQVCNGYSSKCEDGSHILMLDYDNVDYEVVTDDIYLIQGVFDLPTAYLFYTNISKDKKQITGSFHVVFLCKLEISKILEIMSYTHIDENFKTSPARNIFRTWVLRLSKKKKRKEPKFIKLISGNNNKYEISSAHKTLISKFYKDVRHPFYKNEDNLKIIKLQRYETFK